MKGEPSTGRASGPAAKVSERILRLRARGTCRIILGATLGDRGLMDNGVFHRCTCD